MTGGTREARRRRRILEGSSDRLALITGRPQNLSSTSAESLPTDLIASDDVDSSPPLVSEDSDQKLRFFDPSPVSQIEADKPVESTFTNRDQTNEPDTDRAIGVRSRQVPVRQRRERRRELPSRATPIQQQAPEVRARPEPSSSSAQRPPSSFPTTNPDILTTMLNRLGSATSQQLGNAVWSTEYNRLWHSIVMAFLVLLAYVGFPVFGNKVIRSIILFRPCLLLLMFNIFSIISRLNFDLENSDKDKDGNKSSGADGAWTGEAGRALEVCLMLQNVMGSLFMDFSVYAAIIICGFCLS